MENGKQNKVRVLVECAMLIAIGTVLAQIKIYGLPNGGAVTLVSMLPFIIASFRHGTKWGLATGFVNSLLQMMLGWWAPPAGTITAYIGMILLDYVLAFTLLGLASAFAKPFGNRKLAGVAFGTFMVCLIRFICSFLSGFLIWGSLAVDGMGAVVYSLGYNASYMVPETIITVAVAVILYKTAPKLFNT